MMNLNRANEQSDIIKESGMDRDLSDEGSGKQTDSNIDVDEKVDDKLNEGSSSMLEKNTDKEAMEVQEDDADEDEEDKEDDQEQDALKKAKGNDPYNLCIKYNLAGIAPRLGLSAENLGKRCKLMPTNANQCEHVYMASITTVLSITKVIQL